MGGDLQPRVPLIEARDGLDDQARSVFDRVVETRGELIRPFQVLLHTPGMAAHVAELGHGVRSASHLSDRDRELATLATGAAHRCAFVWRSHLAAAGSAGIDQATIDSVVGGGAPLDRRDAHVVAFARELCAGALTPETFAAAHEPLGDRGVVELALTVGYYAMLAYVMSACDAC
jgi:4-carboxymuconolactone decarboxylase